jgi:hypothetical protein
MLDLPIIEVYYVNVLIFTNVILLGFTGRGSIHENSKCRFKPLCGI